MGKKVLHDVCIMLDDWALSSTGEIRSIQEAIKSLVESTERFEQSHRVKAEVTNLHGVYGTPLVRGEAVHSIFNSCRKE